MTAADNYNAGQIASGNLTFEHITELVKFWQKNHPPLEVDGMAGSMTLATVSGTIRPAPFLMCPLPVLADGRKATITSSFRPADRPNHDGCDWFYEWRVGDKPDFVGDHGAAGYVHDSQHTFPKWVVPTGTLAIAAAAGVVQLADNSPTGYRVWIDHGNGWRTGYFHLLSLHVKVGDRVMVDTSVGLVGDNPADNDGRHLHFELSPVNVYAPTDPEPYLLR